MGGTLGNKAFRFGIFRDRISAIQGCYYPCFATEISWICRVQWLWIWAWAEGGGPAKQVLLRGTGLGKVTRGGRVEGSPCIMVPILWFSSHSGPSRLEFNRLL